MGMRFVKVLSHLMVVLDLDLVELEETLLDLGVEVPTLDLVVLLELCLAMVLLPPPLVVKCQDKNVRMYQDNSATMCQDNSARMCQGSSARMSRDKNVPMCQDRSAELYPDNSAIMCQDKHART